MLYCAPARCRLAVGPGTRRSAEEGRLPGSQQAAVPERGVAQGSTRRDGDAVGVGALARTRLGTGANAAPRRLSRSEQPGGPGLGRASSACAPTRLIRPAPPLASRRAGARRPETQGAMSARPPGRQAARRPNPSSDRAMVRATSVSEPGWQLVRRWVSARVKPRRTIWSKPPGTHAEHYPSRRTYIVRRLKVGPEVRWPPSPLRRVTSCTLGRSERLLRQARPASFPYRRHAG